MKSAWLNLRRSRYFTGPYNETPDITIIGAPPYSVLPEGCAPDQLGTTIRVALEASMDEPASWDDARGRAEERTLHSLDSQASKIAARSSVEHDS